MPDYVVARITEALNEVGKPVKGSRILAVGLAYKPGVSDLRESPSLAVAKRLIDRGADLSYHDPFIPQVDLDGRDLASVDLSPEMLGHQDCVVILTAHPRLDVAALVEASPLVFDTRGVTRNLTAPHAIRL
jgi:UDP-N-acetyl-D-glucosamine dehydrogenase